MKRGRTHILRVNLGVPERMSVQNNESRILMLILDLIPCLKVLLDLVRREPESDNRPGLLGHIKRSHLSARDNAKVMPRASQPPEQLLVLLI